MWITPDLDVKEYHQMQTMKACIESITSLHLEVSIVYKPLRHLDHIIAVAFFKERHRTFCYE